MAHPPALIRLADALALPEAAQREAETLLHHGSMDLMWYAPPMPDTQTPHRRDELYVVATGTGTFIREHERCACGPGDVLFVAAGIEHHFAECSSDFGVWVVFWGPHGGEVA
jgi:mannose-6-phosphate isomerase-like protein (cupin superfamily)